MRALVTGCAGFIGSHLAESLLGDGHEVLGVDCFNDNYSREKKQANLTTCEEHDAFELSSHDLTEADLDGLLEGQDVVFHLAGEPGVRDSWGTQFDRYVRNNVLVTQRLLEAARHWPGKRFVYASSSSVYGQAMRFPTGEDTQPRPLSPYGMTKSSAEQLCDIYQASFGVPVVSLRYFSVYGPRQRPDMAFTRFCRAAVDGTPVTLFGDGKQTRDFTFVGDVVAATRAAAAAEAAVGRVYNVGGGSRVSLGEALEMLAQLAEAPIDVRRAGAERGDVRDTGADTSRARRELEFEPTVSLEQGLSLQLDWARGLVRC